MKKFLFNPVFLVLASLILPVISFLAMSHNAILADILFALFVLVMALIALRK
ncbi:hypothetical protein [Thalassospira sp. TSL5-1]|uniref:hypothetical protein n=1 Tax=Thalassospira sp. TSL5-1 TaxID=1544451 RepID=UPI000B201CCD|nr:hypothetical protein [Thalassospira sp. TSL5-1]